MTSYLIKLLQKRVVRTKLCIYRTQHVRFHFYHWVDTSAGRLLATEDMPSPVVSVSTLPWHISLPRVTLTDFGSPVESVWFIYSPRLLNYLVFLSFWLWAYLMKNPCLYIDYPSVAVGYDISPLKRVKLKLLTTSRQTSAAWLTFFI